MADLPTLYDVYDDFAPPSAFEEVRRVRKVVPLSERGDLASGTSEAYRTDNPSDYIRRLIIEANTNVMPEDVPMHAEDRLLGIRPKLPNRMVMDRRRAYFLDRMLDTFGRPSQTVGESDPVTGASSGSEYGPRPEAWSKLPEDVADAMWAYSTGDPVNVAGKYENTGWLGPGSPLGAVSKWMMATPSAAYGVSELAANAVGGRAKPTSEVVNDIARAGETLLAPVLRGDSAFSDMSKFRRQIDQDSGFDRDTAWWRGSDGSYSNLYPSQDDMAQVFEAQAGQMDGGEELLERYKVDDLIGRLGTRVLGGVMDATVNPFFGGADMIAAAKAGKMLKSAGLAATEWGPDTAFAGYRTYLENKRK